MFDFNKLDEYKKAMEVLGIKFHCFHGYLLQIEDNYFKISAYKGGFIGHGDWETFKEQVAIWFLNSSK